MYSVGDKVAYPMHGAGVIEAIEDKQFIDEMKRYYVLQFTVGDMKVLVPVDNVSNSGLRKIISAEVYEQVLRKFADGEETEESLNWNRRFRENMEKMKTGDIFEMVSVVKCLLKREKEKGLSSGEKKMLNNAMQILVSELCLVSGEKKSSLEKKIISLV